MIEQAKFELIKTKYGHYASWAIWAEEGEKPKDNIGDLSVFDIENNNRLLQQLNPNIITSRAEYITKNRNPTSVKSSL